MSYDNSNKATFQITVNRLTLSSPLPEQDIRVTVAVGDKSKITCSGKLSNDGLTVLWNHPFLFAALPSDSVQFAAYILPELTPGWDKQPLGEKIVINIASLLESGNKWQCNIPGLQHSLGTLSIICKTSDVLTVSDGHKCLSALIKYDAMLCEFSQQFKNLSSLFTKVEVAMAILDFCPLGHANHTSMLHKLAASFQYCYDQGGNILDLNKAIETHQTRLDLCPLEHPEHIQALGDLSTSLRKHYHIQKNETDLKRIIQMRERILDLCPADHSYHAKALGRLASSLSDRYNVQGDMVDLNRAIEMEEKRLDLCPPGHHYHAEALGNLAVSLWARYKKLNKIADLNKAINLEEKKLQLRPPGHRNHGLALENLAFSLQDRFKAIKAHSDLIRAVQLFKEALTTYTVQHYYFAHVANALAAATLLLYKIPQPNQPPPSLEDAFEVYRQLQKCGPTVSLHLLRATKEWVKNAEYYDHPSVLEAYETALNTLDHFTSLNPSLESRHGTMQGKITDLASDAFSCAIRHGRFKMAAELLEQGRGILWNQLARFDISVAALESRDHALAGKFTRLSADLRLHAQGGDSSEAYWRVKDEWESVVDEIRRLDGFSRFLLPPLLEDLQGAAELGPIIIVNASKYGCDALIVQRTGLPVHVSLPCSLPDIDQLCSQMSVLTRDAYAFGDHRESWVKVMLGELWSTVVEPIATVLQNEIQLPLGSRIWWCPTSTFTKLPFHAAGPHRKSEKNMFDLYVSSYTPSLSALVRTHDRIRSQRAVREASGTPSPVSFAAVGQGRPSTDTKQSELPEVAYEIQRIQNETGIPSDVVFDVVSGDMANVEGAMQAFRDHRWVHLACHGSQHTTKPFDSWFSMGDGKLTLMRIIQERYTNSEFAFLSACHTAVGDASTPDEVLHLAAGMQFAGFNGVIGTLWRVDDAVAHKVATQFYKEMFKQPVIGFENAAVALNSAVVETADEVSLEKRIVFVHIGI